MDHRDGQAKDGPQFLQLAVKLPDDLRIGIVADITRRHKDNVRIPICLNFFNYFLDRTPELPGCVAHEGVIDGILDEYAVGVVFEDIVAEAIEAVIRRVPRNALGNDSQGALGITRFEHLPEEMDITAPYHPPLGQRVPQGGNDNLVAPPLVFQSFVPV